MNKNEKKKNAIRFGAIAVAILLFAGAFSVWALSTQATASAGVGTIQAEGVKAFSGSNANSTDILLEDSVAGRPGQVAVTNNPYEVFTITDGNAVGTQYVATVYLTNGAKLMNEGMRYMTLDIEIRDAGDNTIDSATLTLENGRVSFEFGSGTSPLNGEGDVVVTGGSYGTYPFQSITSNVQFTIDVEGV